jgi:hypothetical protein
LPIAWELALFSSPHSDDPEQAYRTGLDAESQETQRYHEYVTERNYRPYGRRCEAGTVGRQDCREFTVLTL